MCYNFRHPSGARSWGRQPIAIRPVHICSRCWHLSILVPECMHFLGHLSPVLALGGHVTAGIGPGLMQGGRDPMAMKQAHVCTRWGHLSILGPGFCWFEAIKAHFWRLGGYQHVTLRIGPCLIGAGRHFAMRPEYVCTRPLSILGPGCKLFWGHLYPVLA